VGRRGTRAGSTMRGYQVVPHSRPWTGCLAAGGAWVMLHVVAVVVLIAPALIYAPAWSGTVQENPWLSAYLRWVESSWATAVIVTVLLVTFSVMSRYRLRTIMVEVRAAHSTRKEMVMVDMQEGKDG